MEPKFRQVKIKKVEDIRFDGHHPRGIDVGYETQGILFDEPHVGLPFWVSNFHTSVVTHIDSPTRFRTLNSIYEIEIIEP